MAIHNTNKSVVAKKVTRSFGKAARAAPGWIPTSSSEEDDPPVLTRRKPKTFPPIPLPPVDASVDLDDRSVLVAANEQAEEENEPILTTETTNLRVVPFNGNRHQTILPIPPPISDEENVNSSGEEDTRESILVPSSVESPPRSQSSEILVPANSDEMPPQTILIPSETESHNIEFIPVDESRSVKETFSGGMPPSIKPPSSHHLHRPHHSHHRPEHQQRPLPPLHRQKVKVKRPKPFEVLPPIRQPPVKLIEPSTEIVREELESDELVPVVEPIVEPPVVIPSNPYSTVPKIVEKPKIVEEKPEYIEPPKRPSIVLTPKKTRKMYKVYRPDVVEVNQGPLSPSRSIYVAKRPPILVEQIEIPTELIESLQKYSTPLPPPVAYERTTLRKGSGQFLPRRSSYRRTYQRAQTQIEATTTTLIPSTVKRLYNTSYKRLLFTYKPRFITAEPPYAEKTTEVPVQFVYKKSGGSYREIVVRQKQKPTVYRKQPKTYPKHQKYSRSYGNKKQFPQGYQRQLTRHSFYGYA